ncbi:MAG: FAD-dependent thymidylate synthase [Gemmatimonadetes bacterium]|nr:FAD-dependent thymidylate synthase [Gemmatimonadota bacterium]
MSLPATAILRAPTVTVLARPQFEAPAHLPVAYVGDASDGERLAEFAGRLHAMSQDNPAQRPTREYLATIRTQAMGHALDHASYTLLLEGVSRAAAHALLRPESGLASSELSPRFVDTQAAPFVMPPAIIGDAALEAAWTAQVASALASYAALVESLMTRYAWIDDKVQRRTIARDAARGVLPSSAETKLVVSGHARAWRALLARHAAEGAELELRRLGVEMVRVLQAEAPGFFGDFEIHQGSDRREAARTALDA